MGKGKFSLLLFLFALEQPKLVLTPILCDEIGRIIFHGLHRDVMIRCLSIYIRGLLVLDNLEK